MLTDFKISRVEQDDDGRIVSAVVRTYEGEMVDVTDQITGKTVQVYRRTQLLEERVLTTKDLAGSSDVTHVKALACAQLAADTAREPIEAQVLTAEMAEKVAAIEVAVAAVAEQVK